MAAQITSYDVTATIITSFCTKVGYEFACTNKDSKLIVFRWRGYAQGKRYNYCVFSFILNMKLMDFKFEDLSSIPTHSPRQYPYTFDENASYILKVSYQRGCSILHYLQLLRYLMGYVIHYTCICKELFLVRKWKPRHHECQHCVFSSDIEDQWDGSS